MQARTLGEVGNLGTVCWGFVPGKFFQFFYGIRFIFDRQGAKYKLAQFFWDTVYKCGYKTLPNSWHLSCRVGVYIDFSL